MNHTVASFVTLWVMAFSFHYLDSHPLSLLPVLLGASAVPCLASPGSSIAWALFLLAGMLAVLADLPAVSNHFLLALAVHLIFAGTGLSLLARRRDPRPPGGTWSFHLAWFSAVRTPIGQTIVAVYLLAAFHKLNTSFFDPAVSCAGTLTNQGLTLLGFPGTLATESVATVAVLTVLVESAIPILIALRHWRLWGMALGAAFHVTLGAALFYDFGTYVLAIYVLLLPPESAERVRHPTLWRGLALGAWTAHVGLTVAARASATAASPIPLTWHALQFTTWLFAVGFLAGPVLATALRMGDVPRWPETRPRWLALLPAIVILNGMTPYLGLKTVSSFSMFSNLRTEDGVSNHLVPGILALEMAHNLRDTVEIVDLHLPRGRRLEGLERARGGVYWLNRQTRWLAEGMPVRVPWMELRRAVHLWKAAGVRGVRIVYRRNGLERTVADAVEDAELAAPLSWWTRTFLGFRAIDPQGVPVPCRW